MKILELEKYMMCLTSQRDDVVMKVQKILSCIGYLGELGLFMIRVCIALLLAQVQR